MAKVKVGAISCRTLADIRDLNDGKNFMVLGDLWFDIYYKYEGDRTWRKAAVKVPTGFVTDLASACWPVPKLTKGNRYYILHDWGWRECHPPFDKDFWDQAMREGLLADELPYYRAQARYLGVKSPIGNRTWNKYQSARNDQLELDRRNQESTDA